MRSEFITVDELKGQLRQQGILEVTEVRQACLEANGELSVIKVDSDDQPKAKKKKAI